jgi:ankyrin repeat protein
MSKLGINIFTLIFLTVADLSASDPPIFSSIKDNDIQAIAEFISNNDINGFYGTDSTTLLVFSIQSGSGRVVKYLLEKGADPDKFVMGISPLMHAVLEGSRIKINLLLDNNAKINARDSYGNHSLIYAAVKGDVGIIKILLRHGAYLNMQNKTRLTAYDFAVKSNNSEAAKYLKFRYEKNLPELVDGPYIEWNKKKNLNAFYLHHDSVQNYSKKIIKSFKTNSDTFLMEGFFRDNKNYLLFKNSSVEPSEFKNVDKILIMGDVHGGYDSLVKLLINNNIVDTNLNWKWGSGHIVFLGDIFDRGDKVTETFWLIYKLDHQSVLYGGRVHLLFGNHEILVLLKDQTYITDKYYYLCKKLNLSYGSLYSDKTILGQWLRKNNSIIKINDKLFVHAGISPQIVKAGLTLDDINKMVRFFINHPERNRKFGLTTKDLIMGDMGPFWYRGFIEDNSTYKQITETDLDKILKFYNVTKIFAGHTNVENISAFFDNKVFILDVPFYTSTAAIRALLSENNTLFLLKSDGTKEKFK